MHPAFQSSPALIRPTDIIQYYEVSEEELDSIYEQVDRGEWDYRTEDIVFRVDDWLKEYVAHESELEELQRKQRDAQKTLRQV